MISYLSTTTTTLILFTTLLLTSITSTKHNAEAISVKSPTSRGALQVLLTYPDPIITKNNTYFNITFIRPDFNTVQVHVLYDFIILNKSEDVVFRSANQTQGWSYTPTGVAIIPYTFETQGKYTIHIRILGINFFPRVPEFADFPIKVE